MLELQATKESLTARINDRDQRIDVLNQDISNLDDQYKEVRKEQREMVDEMTNLVADLAAANEAREAAEARANRLAAAATAQELPLLPAEAVLKVEGEALGAGASGTVYRASLTQPVAVKRANVRLSADGTATADDVTYNKRCQALVDGEAAQLGRYGNHPNIVRAVG
ncbi:hypothetical protein WJX75_003476 [Coccomyxa subellipsoidea]|uniref:Protein kinase domain-containing protein n=1 Tax=Coccomyxa subellipsoidea TaxID=248742 RepID=A0ABR2Z0C0_9CHLO